jgi:hypothetical protein
MSSNDTPNQRRATGGRSSAAARSGRPDGRQGHERIALKKQQEAAAARSRKIRRRTIGALAVVATLVIGVVVAVAVVPSTPVATPVTGLPVVPGPTGPEAVPIEQGPVLASAAGSATGQPVDGVECNSAEQVAYHVHTHLSIYVDGVLRPVPAGIGIVAPVGEQTPEGVFDHASQCYYWLHVHAQDGIIHIESPAGHSYVLGQFFDLWGQPLSTDRVGSATGPLTIWVDGRRYRGDPRTIPLGSHEDVQIDVGGPVVGPHAVRWSATSL